MIERCADCRKQIQIANPVLKEEGNRLLISAVDNARVQTSALGRFDAVCQAGKGFQIWLAEGQVSAAEQIQPFCRRIKAFRPGQGILNRNHHIRCAHLCHHRAIHIFDHRMDDALRMNHNLDFFRRHREQPHRFNKLQSLVHQGRGINGNLGTHAPVGVAKCLLLADSLELFPAFSIEWSARSSNNQPLYGICRISLKALENRGVLAVDWGQQNALLPNQIGHQLAARNQCFLISQRHIVSGFDCSHGWQQTRYPHQSIDDGILLLVGNDL